MSTPKNNFKVGDIIYHKTEPKSLYEILNIIKSDNDYIKVDVKLLQNYGELYKKGHVFRGQPIRSDYYFILNSNKSNHPLTSIFK